MSEPIRLPRLLTEAEAAETLGVSSDTLLRERKRGEISYALIGNRVRYTEAHLNEYIENRTRRCRANDPEPSALTGSVGDPIPTSGAAPGTTATLDRHDAYRSLNLILNKRI